MDQIAPRVLRFELFALDLTRGCLRMGDQDIDLRPKAFDVLRHLAENAGRLVPKEELFEAVWPNVTVGDDSLVQCIRELRDKLGGDDHRLIKTAPRRGYLLDAALTPAPQPFWDRPATPEGPPSIVANRSMPPRLLRTVQARKWPIWGAAAGLLCAALGAMYLPALFAPAWQKPTSLAETAPVPPQPRRTFRDCDVCPEMVELPAGEFMMGSPESEGGRDGNEGPQRRVLVAEGFAVGKFEVTIDQFAAFVADTGFEPSHLCHAFRLNRRPTQWPEVTGSFREPGFRVSGMHPAVCVSWHDAQAYVAWLSRKTAKSYRLPTEGEWEYAARASTTTAFSFGDDVTTLCEFARFADMDSGFPWRAGCHSKIFEPGAFRVGTLAPNPWGLFDMHGNAWEWVEDCWTSDARLLPSDASANRQPAGCESRSTRGGAWAAQLRRVRSAERKEQPAVARFYHLGFRVALSLGPPPGRKQASLAEAAPVPLQPPPVWTLAEAERAAAAQTPAR